MPAALNCSGLHGGGGTVPQHADVYTDALAWLQMTYLYVREGVNSQVVDLSSLPVDLTIAIIELFFREAASSFYV